MAEDIEKDPARQLDLGRVLAALADPNRRRVIAELAASEGDEERNCQTFDLPLAKSTKTYLFNVLEEAGLTDNVDYGNRRGVTLRRSQVDDRFPGLLRLIAQEAPAGSA